MQPRLLSLSLALAVAVLAGGLTGCAPTGGDSNLGLAQVSLAQGDYAAALASIDETLATDPDNVEALALRADVLFEQGQATEDLAQRLVIIEDMAETVQRAQAIAPDDPAVLAARDRAWFLAVNSGNESLRADGANAATFFQRGVDVQPDSVQGYFGLGLARYRDGDLSAAVAPFERARAIDPSDPTIAIYYSRALVGSDRATEGLAALEEAATQFPEDEDIQTEILNVYARSGNTEEAIARYEASIASRPNDTVVRYNYGSLLLRAQRYDEAIEQFEEAIRIDPQNADALYNLGATYQNRAAALNEQANATDDNAEANRLLQQRDENLEASLPYFERARTIVAGEQGEASVCSALFQVYTQLNRIDEAEGVAECAGFATD